MSIKTPIKARVQAFYFILLFIFIEVFLAKQLKEVSLYSTYLLEIIFIVVNIYYWKNSQIHVIKPKTFMTLLNLALGCFSGLVAQHFFSPLPFSVNSFFLISLFIFFGPILEEFLFREALWLNFSKIMPQNKNAFWTNTVTAILFSLAHLQVYISVPEAFKHFILFQAFYTLALGFYWGSLKTKEQNLTPAIYAHICFNLGFFLTLIL